MLTANPFAAVDKQWVIGTLKATGSTDPDVLYAARVKLIGAVAVSKTAGVGVTLLGGLLLVVAVGRWVGLPLIGAGWLLWRRGVRNVATVEAGYAEYTAVGRSRPGR